MAESRQSTHLHSFLPHYGRIQRLLARLLGGAAAADAVQETYLRLLSFAPEGPRDPRAYINTVARHVATDRGAAARRDWLLRAPPETIDTLADEAPSPEAVMEHKLRLHRMAEALNELPPACRAAFVMNKLDGLDHRTIAAQLGVSRSMVEKHILRALTHCRDRLRAAAEHD